jgi:hypothetical protein
MTTISTTAAGKLPTTWDDARDSAFFRITARLFSPAFCLGAGVRLASNDDTVDVATPEPSNSTAVPTGVDVDLTPVRVRRTA